MELDNSQSKFLKEFETEIQNFKNDFFILTGPAGSGKTEVIKEAVKICEDNNVGHQCLAFTGRAASVLRNRGLKNAKTIDSWMYQLNKQTTFEENFFNNDSFVFFIDESSMISNSAVVYKNREPELDFKLDEIMWSTFRHIPCKNIMFIFVGDSNQLPPLKHDYCPALDENYFRNRYGLNGISYSLNKIHRQTSESEITKVAKNFMQQDNQTVKRIPPLNNIKDDVTVIQNDEIIPYFFDFYFQNKHDVKIITATNKKADYYNFLIKEKLSSGATGKFHPYQIPNDYLEPQKGDILQLFENTGAIYEFPLFNGQFVEVIETGLAEEEILSKGSQVPDRIPFINQEIYVETISDNGLREGNLQNIRISIDHLVNSVNLNKEQYEYFDKKGDSVLDNIKNYASKAISKRIFFDKQYNPVLTRYGYAITGHKAQGGGWNNIIIDFSGFNDDNGHLPPSWIYTAITRAKSNLLIANYPEELSNE